MIVLSVVLMLIASIPFHSNSSDVVLISEDGKRFHAHRLVLCAQSAVFKAMMASQEWGTSKRNEVCPGGARTVYEYTCTVSCCLLLYEMFLSVVDLKYGRT